MSQERVLTLHYQDVLRGERFQFGENWKRFLRVLTAKRIEEAEQSLKEMLEVENLEGFRFLDIGSGSGLFSLAARRLGATVHSFDYDPQSVACTRELKRRHFPNDGMWTIDEGSVLDMEYLKSLGKFDVVYSWGVLHHTGAMWQALENASIPVRGGGTLYVAIYNDQRWLSSYWRQVKKLYNRNLIFRLSAIVCHLPWFAAIHLVQILVIHSKPRSGMARWNDLIDWLGGYPFEVAKPEEIFTFYREKRFALCKLKTCGGRMGCNEFVLAKIPQGQLSR
jgi:2-polyprenyl-3-methyl-5-hydroxy-6-metoxy-1,4-benzoquinol methylase